MEPRKPRRGMGLDMVIGGRKEKDFVKKQVNMLFENAEPYFKVILEENRKLTLSEKNTFHGLFVHTNGHTQANIYDMMMNQFEQRIKEGFEYSINVLKQYPVDETFTQHVKDELDRFAYAKDVLLFVFKTQKYQIHFHISRIKQEFNCKVYCDVIVSYYFKNYLTEL